MSKVHRYTSAGGRATLPDTLPKSVEDYLASGAPEGQRNRTLLAVACQLRDIRKTHGEAEAILAGRARADGLPDWEIADVLGKAFSRPPRELPTGAIDTSTGKRIGGDAPREERHARSKGRYSLRRRGERDRNGAETVMRAAAVPVPAPLEDGFETLLLAAFEEGEGVCIAGTREGVPERGAALSRESWIEKVRQRGGIDRVFSAREGLFLRVNPIRPQSLCRNEDVTSFRHVLVEFDQDEMGNPIPKDRQFGMFLASHLPITAVLDSGNKSLHAWVRVDAANAKEFAERAERVYATFTGDVEGLDSGNHNPNRFSRCPDGWRTEGGEHRRQTVVHLRMGAASWAEWEAHREAAEFGAPMRFQDLIAYDVENDPNNVLGNRWLCRGGSLVIVSQSGVGKSSFMAQLAHGWALGRADMAFGIAPVKPLRQLIVQAENDDGDVAEAVQSVANAFGLREHGATLQDRIEWRRISTVTGEEFLARLGALVRLTRPDLVWIDPLMNFVGDDLKEQSVISRFCTEGLNPISMETGTIFILIHHTGKPASAETKRGRTASDLAYSGLGSSALTNWAREVMVLDRVAAPEGDPATFTLTCTKRRRRAGLKTVEGDAAETIHVRHASDGGIYWTQCEAPAETVRQGSERAPGGRYRRGGGNGGGNEGASEPSRGRPSSFDAIAQLKIADFVDTHCGGDVRLCGGEKLLALARLLGKSAPTVRGWLREMGAAREAAENQGVA